MTQWTLPYTNPFQAIRAAADMNGTPDDLEEAKRVFAASTEWSAFDYDNYLDDLLQEIAGKTNIVVQYLGDGEYRAAYDI